MGTKTISLMDDAYDLLKMQKSRNESFSDVVRRLATMKRNIMEFAGALDISDNEAKEIKEVMVDLRKGSIKRTFERIKYI